MLTIYIFLKNNQLLNVTTSWDVFADIK